MLNNYLALGKDIEVRYIEGDEPFAEETFIALKEALVSLSKYFCLKEPFPKIRVILVPNRNEFDRFVIDLLGVEIETPSRPTRMAQPQKTDLVVLSPSAYEQHSTFKYFPDEYKRLLFHEITHMFEEYIAPTSAMETVPRWWSEGLAVYLSGQWKYEDQYRFRQPVLKGIKEKLIPNLKEIQASIELCYDWGWTMVIFIENTYGKESILKIVRECDNGNVSGILGEDFKNFEKRWKEWLLYANVVYEVNPSSHI